MKACEGHGNSFHNGLTQYAGTSAEPLNHVPGIWDGIVWNDPQSRI